MPGLIAREGLPFIAGSAVLTLLSALWAPPALTVLLLGLTLFVTAFFRDPERRSAGPGVLAPADGKVVYVGPGTYPGGPAEMTMVSVFMSVFNVHVNRVPFDGTVTRVERTAGGFVNAARTDAPLVNERTLVVLDTAAGEMAFCQVAGLIARRVVCRLAPGDRAARGARMGMIRFGSRLDLYLPRGWTVKVTVGAHTRAGETVVAEASGGAEEAAPAA